jgi:hypothetical protein
MIGPLMQQMHKNPISTPQETRWIAVIKTNWLVLFGEEIGTEDIKRFGHP